MYNTKTKEQYIDMLRQQNDADIYKGREEHFFKDAEPYEEHFQKDVGLFTTEEFCYMLKDMSKGKTSRTIAQSFYDTMAKYGRSKFPVENHYTGKAREEVWNFIETEISKYVKHTDLQSFLDTLPNAVDKFLVYGLYCGVKGYNCLELSSSSMEDSDDATRMIWLAGLDNDGEFTLKKRKFYADEQLYGYAKEASVAGTKVFTRVGPNGEKQSWEVELQTGDLTIYKVPYNSEKVEGDGGRSRRDRIRKKMVALFKESSIMQRYSLLDIYWSGLIYHTQIKARSEGKLLETMEDYVKYDGIDEIMETYGLDPGNKRVLKANLKRYL